MRYPELCDPGILTKRFPCHFQAQSFDALKLIVRPLFQLAEIHSLQRRKIRCNRGQRAPKKLLTGNSESQRFQRLKQTGAVIRITDFYPAEFLGQPRTGLAHGAFFGSEFPNQIAQRLLVGLNLIAQIAKGFSESVSRMVLD